MSQQPDERELFRRLGDDVDRTRLAAPDELRRRSDRRTAVRAAIGTVAVAVAVGGVLVGGNALSGTAAPDVQPAESSTPTVSETIPSFPPPEPSPTESAGNGSGEDPSPSTATETSGTPTSEIPEAAWLDASDLGYGVSHKGRFSPPSLCGRPLVADALVKSGAAVVNGTRDAIYREPQPGDYGVPEGITNQSIVLLDSRREADALMDAIQAQVADCPEESTRDEPSEITYTLADPEMPAGGETPDRHLLIDVSTSYALYEEIAPAGVDRFDTFISVVQVADAVSILEVHGWETSDTSIEEALRYVGPATERLLDWRQG
jgi:hypothetical protein